MTVRPLAAWVRLTLAQSYGLEMHSALHVRAAAPAKPDPDTPNEKLLRSLTRIPHGYSGTHDAVIPLSMKGSASPEGAHSP